MTERVDQQNSALAVALKDAIKKYQASAISPVDLYDAKDIFSEIAKWKQREDRVS